MALPTLEHEKRLSILEIEHEEKISILDINHHENLVELKNYNWSTDYEKMLYEQINMLIERIEKNFSVKTFKNNAFYWVVSFHAKSHDTMYFPDKDQFNIFKVRAYILEKSYTLPNRFVFKIKTDNINETIDPNELDRSRYSSKQKFLVFDSKEKAMFFRHEYLTIILPYLTEKGVTFVDMLEKKSRVDLDRVIKKAPEYLI